ncbi:hypothetical protein [Spiroplasma eriocheiris]|uniref:Lipoprotein n=1 Tax=Spiroplasma eriocheiris TaxID=315358 RepID=A0A0H3XMB0_9MOLU|nr:hypothetical protein [Spiroplasma eriocheiris]AHF58304.1 putative lipoprotein [Spiroplasma eriocheiris CCTCC M 207170]AKM54739.1 hypothetical protein SERIO_v1c11900 [Spiroplasma eriocheiris]
MKKLLACLGALTITTSSASTILACNPGSTSNKTKKDPVVNPIIDKDRKIIKKFTKWTVDSPLLFNSANYQSLKVEDLKQIITNQLPMDKNYEVVLDNETYQPINVKGTEVNNGSIDVSILHKGMAIADRETKQSVFTVNFLTKEINDAKNFWRDLNEKTPGSVSRLTDFKLNFNGAKMSLKTILGLIPSLVSLGKLPTTIPNSFASEDPNQKQWTEFTNQLTRLPAIGNIMKITFDETFEVASRVKIKISGNVGDIINALAPDLIHFHNFLLSQKSENHNNLILSLMQYLFKKPTDINNDGFTKINSQVKHPITTNLDSIIHNLFQSWQTTTGESSKITEPFKLAAMIKIPIWGWETYQIKWDRGDIDLGNKNINKMGKDLFSQLLNHDLTKDVSLKIDLGSIIPTIPVSIPLTKLVNSLIPELLVQPDFNNDEITNNNLTILSGKSVFEITKDGKNWEAANNIGDILNEAVKDVRLKIENLKLKVTSKNDSTVSFETNDNMTTTVMLDIDLNSILK